MTRRWWPAAAFLLAAAGAAIAPGVALAAESHKVAIVNYTYAPETLEVQAGDTVSWRNLDAVIHTVTAEEGAFVSGSIRQGQTYSLQFNTPGVFKYFCEPHEEMRGRVVVLGASAPPPPSTSSTTTPAREERSRPTTVTAPPAAATPTSVAVESGAPATSTATTMVSVPAEQRLEGAPLAAAPPAVSGGIVTGVRRGLPTLVTALAVLLIAGAAPTALGARGVRASTATRIAVAALTLATGVFHFQLHFVLSYPEPIGSLMLMHAAAATLLAAYVIAWPWSRSVLVAGVAFHAASIGAFVLARVGPGLFGYHERGWDPSPQAVGAVAVEAAAIVLLLVTAFLVRRESAQGALVATISTTNHSDSSGPMDGPLPRSS